MIVKTKKLWFKKLQVFLESTESLAMLKNKYDSVMFVSYDSVVADGYTIREKDTALINLRPMEDEIFKNFSDTTKNEIRKTYKNTEHSFKLNTNFDESYGLYSDFEISQGRVPVTKNEISLFKSHLSYQGLDPIYGFYVVESFPYARIRSIFSKRLSVDDTETKKIISNGGRRLLLEICKDLKSRGFVSLDMASVNMDNPKTINISKFKMSFGGDVRKEYTYIYKGKVFTLFEFVFKIIRTIR
jgi:hypothetical protein